MSGSFTVDTKQLQKMAVDLKRASYNALPTAVRESLNTTAFEARKQWLDEMKAKFTLRNTWTQRSVRVEKAAGLTLATMQSRVGSLVPYMATQELGGTENATGKHGVPIPTTTAAGQSMKAPKRTRQVQRRNWQSAIILRRGMALKGHVTRGRRNSVAIEMAARGGGGVAFLNLGKRKGLFRVSKTGKGKVRVRMIWDMSRKSVTAKPRPTLEPTVKWVTSRAPEWQRDALIKQLRKRKVFGY